MYCLGYFNLCLALCWIQLTKCKNLKYSLEGEIAQLISNKGYLPDDKDLPKSSVVKGSENDATYVLTKLSDEALVKLLNELPKRSDYKMDDIIKISENLYNHRINLENAKTAQNESPQPIFRLENKKVDPYNTVKTDADPNYIALQKISNMLYSRPQADISAEKKEMLFDILLAQLKTLCCEKNKIKKISSIPKKKKIKNPTEYIFLVLNDEIKSNTSEELIRVDPESLSKNSSVLVLGPMTTPLSDVQTKLVMSRISKELSRPEYLPLLDKISNGKLGKKNSDILNSLITGPDTRRYIKPHRCNHQSQLTKIYNGPKWIICTGYLNLNTPSLYD